ncbi:MAG TPA: MFS transporter [Ramlibacter sp.]|nr:MFS transporter [Ramlibacter sp.]
MPENLSPRRELWLLLTLAGIQLTHIMDFMIMMPLGPQFTALFHITEAQFGLLVSAYTLAAGASGLVASTYIDRFGRKRLLLVLYSLFALATLACGLAPGYGWLMAARVAAGLFGGVLSALCQTIIADSIPFERRGRAMALVMTSFSVSTVAGVPVGLFLAARFNWHVPFIAIAVLSGLFAVFAALTLPRLNAHLQPGRPAPFRAIAQVLGDREHQKAFVFSALLMSAGFTVIPYVTIYMTANAGLRAEQIPYIYLCGGAATLISARLVGRMTDRRGKIETFRLMALIGIVPLGAVTVAAGLPLLGLLVVTTSFFVFMNARMVPGMALISAVASPQLRGTFMTLNASVQSAALGVASLVGGLLIDRGPQGQVRGYWLAALVGAVMSLAAVWLAGRLRLPPAAPAKT